MLPTTVRNAKNLSLKGTTHLARTSTAEAILALAAEMREGNVQLVAWRQQSSERQERQNQATIAALNEFGKEQE